MGKNRFKTSIGGQALIEGVMMRGPNMSSMAVRLPDGTVDIEETPLKNTSAWYKKTPFIRGTFNMVDSLVLGYKCLMKSAEKSGMDDGEPSKFEEWLAQKSGKPIMSIVSVVALVLGAGLAMLLFMVLPTLIVSWIPPVLFTPTAKSFAEGIVKIVIFILYIWLVSKLEDIRRVFMYHGAEHKTIFCYESGEELTIENVRSKSRFHPRCGTSFLLIVLVISILLFSVLTWSNVFLRIFLKLLLLPVVIGISYEIIKLAGRYDNPLTRFISAPGIWLQRLTTVEPDDSQIEVAIASIIPVIPKEKGADEW